MQVALQGPRVDGDGDGGDSGQGAWTAGSRPTSKSRADYSILSALSTHFDEAKVRWRLGPFSLMAVGHAEHFFLHPRLQDSTASPLLAVAFGQFRFCLPFSLLAFVLYFLIPFIVAFSSSLPGSQTSTSVLYPSDHS